MRKTKAMLEEENEFYRLSLSSARKEIRGLESELKTLKENMVYLRSFGENLNKSFNACEVVANTLSHALRLQMNANGVR